MAADDSPAIPGTQTLTNGLSVLRAVAGGARSLKDVRDRVPLPRSTIHRLVSALRVEGFLRDSDEGLTLGPALISLGFAAVAANPLVEIARSVLADLSDITLDTVHLAIEEDDAVLYLAKTPGRRGAEMRSQVGHRMPLTRTGIGKSLLLDSPRRWREQYEAETPVGEAGSVAGADVERFLAAMSSYRELGITLDLEENEPGVRCVAAPVFGPQNTIVAAISVSATTPYMPQERMRELIPVVAAHAHRISTGLGFTGTNEAEQAAPSAERFAELFRIRTSTDHPSSER